MLKAKWIGSALVLGMFACSGKSTLGSGDGRDRELGTGSEPHDDDSEQDQSSDAGTLDEAEMDVVDDANEDDSLADEPATDEAAGADVGESDEPAEADEPEETDEPADDSAQDSGEDDPAPANSGPVPSADDYRDGDTGPAYPSNTGAGGAPAVDDNPSVDGGSSCEYFESLPIVDVSELPRDQGASDEDCALIDAQIVASRDASKSLDVAPLAGSWRDGMGDEAVEVVIDATGHGTIRYGEPAELPAIDDPADPYLSEGGANTPLGFLDVAPRLGFEYTLFPESGRASEMTATLRLSEPWRQWCSLQQPHRVASCYACDPSAGLGMTGVPAECRGELPECLATATSPSGETVAAPISCERRELCGGILSVCACTSEDCSDNPSMGNMRSFSLDPVDVTVLRAPDRYGSSTRYLVRVE